MPADDRPSLFQQLMGAVIGGSLALGLYYAYEAGMPALTGYLTLPEPEGGRMYDLGAANIADRTLEDRERKRFVSKNLQVAERMENREFNRDSMQSVDDHSLDINWEDTEEAKKEVKQVAFEVEEVVIEDEADDPEEEPEWPVNNLLFEEQKATQEVAMEHRDPWSGLMQKAKRDDEERVVESDAEGLPDTGFGFGLAATAAIGAAIGARLKKRS